MSHGIGAFAVLIALPFLVMSARPHGTASMAGVAVFGLAAAALFLSSTLYHSLTRKRAKRVFQIADHCAIYLLIAGTYTPFTFGILRGPTGSMLFAIVWTLAAAGIVKTLLVGNRYQKFSTAVYLAMGWLALVAIKQLWLLMPGWGFTWLLAGGVFYTAGVMFFATDYRPYHHFMWHLFVLGGTVCHFVAVWGYSA